MWFSKEGKDEFVITNFYKTNLNRDMEEYSRMQAKIESIKETMGNKYILAKSVEKKDANK